MLIARLTAQLRCYLPEPVDETWGRLRHLGARREQLIDRTRRRVQQIRDLLECVWPAALDDRRAAVQVPRPGSPRMTVVVDRDGGDLARTRRLGWPGSSTAVRREVTRRGGQTALPADRRATCSPRSPTPPVWSRTAAARSNGSAGPGGLGTTTEQRLAETEAPDGRRPRRAGADRPGLLDRRDLSPVGAAAILAETGDLRRFTTARAVVKHAGLAPREKLSGHLRRPHQAHRRRPATAAGRRLAGGVGMPAEQPVYAARYRHLTTREHNKLKPTQAQTVVAAAILRQLHAVVTTGQAWDPDIAAHGDPGKPATVAAGRLSLTTSGGVTQAGSGRAFRGIENPRVSRRSSQAAPPVVDTTRSHAAGHQPDYRYAGTDDGPGTDQTLDAKRLTLMVGRRPDSGTAG